MPKNPNLLFVFTDEAPVLYVWSKSGDSFRNKCREVLPHTFR